MPGRLAKLGRGRVDRGLVGIAAAGVLVALGYGVDAYVRRLRQDTLEHWRVVLGAMADDRKAGMLRWLDERSADVAALAVLSGAEGLAHGGGAGGGRRSAGIHEEHMDAFLARPEKAVPLAGIALLDSRGTVLAEPNGGIPLPEPLRRWAVEAARAPEPTRLDFVEVPGRRPLLAFLAPVGPGGRPGGEPPNLLVLLVDPEHWLFPFLRHDPLGTATAETLVSRRDGGFVTYLSPLRFDDAAPLTFRIPITGARVASFDAVGGTETFGEYVDYRGAEVLAATRHVPGVRWGLVAKIDRREAFAPYYAKLSASGLAGLSLLLGLACLGYAVWRHQRAAHSEALARRDERYRLLSDNANDIVLFLDMEGRLLEANAAAEKAYGRSRDVLCRMSVADLRAPEALGDWDGHRSAAAAEGVARFETVHRRADDSVFPVEVGASVARLGEIPVLLEVVRDVTERKAAEARIRQLNRLLRTLSEVNQMMVREADPTRLLARACAVLVEHGGFRMAWVGLADETSGELRPVAQAGLADGYPEEAPVRWDDSPRGRGPGGTAIRAGRPVICNDIESDGSFEPWREAARRRGYRACAAFPIRARGRAVHVLAVYAADTGAFGIDEAALLGELAEDIGFALHALDEHEERERAEGALRLHGAALESAANAVVVCNREGTILWTNPAFTELTGWAREEAVGQTPRLLRSGVHDRAFYRELWDTVLGGEVWRGEIVNRRKDGALYGEEMTITPLRDAAGQVSHLIAIKQDLRWRHEAESKLRESEARFRGLVQGLDAIVWEADAQSSWRPTFVSDQSERILGYPPERWLAEENFWLGHVHPDDRRLFEPGPFRRPLLPGRFEMEYRMRAADGRMVWFHDVATVSVDGSGAPTRVSGLMVDTTRQRELEHAVQAAAAEWTRTFDALDSGLVVLNRSGCVLRLNRAAAACAGREPAGCVGCHLGTLGPGEPWRSGLALLEQAHVDGEGVSCGPVRDALSGRWWDLAATAAETDEGDRVILLVRDVTAFVGLEQAARQDEQMAAMGRLTAGVAHEVRNPLFAISANVDALCLILAPSHEVTDLLESVRAEVKRVNALMLDLLRYGRPSTPVLQDTPVGAVVELAAQFAGPRALERGVRLCWPREGTVELALRADRERLAGALANLFENAIQHSPAGEEVSVALASFDEAGRTWVRCAVGDRGPGFGAEDLSHVFEPFFTRRQGGTGLGLSIAQKTIGQHGGRIRAENRSGGGALVTVELPCLVPGEARVTGSER